MKVARNEKRKKLFGFSFYINIGNFEAFFRNLNLSANRLFLRCEQDKEFEPCVYGRGDFPTIGIAMVQLFCFSKITQNSLSNYETS